MNADKSFSSLSISEKRKRLMAMVDMRKKMERKKAERPISVLENEHKTKSKKSINGSTKKKKLNAHTYKKMFRNMVQKHEQGPKSSFRIEEYWVPVHLSNMQIEQYCSLLYTKFEALSSSLRNNSSLNDILIHTQKCCDHPYLVDPTLRGSLITDVAVADQFDAEISVSGKLQLLDKLLLEIERCNLRVVVLFQSVASSKDISIGDILEDLVIGRFGQRYIRIHGKILSRKERENRKKDLKMFNDVNTTKFICLLDYRPCHPTITLSSVDIAILFNSDWNPSNDLKALHKITLDSQLRVLRLYSSFTIEEKALILSNQGTILDSNTDRINYNTCHRLLAWGASYLFSKDPSSESESKSKSKSDNCLISVDDLVHELSSMLMNKNRNTNRFKSSIVSIAQFHEGVYSRNILLSGEIEAHTKESSSIDDYLMEKGPLVFWTKLFEESPWKNSCSRLSRRVQKSFRDPSFWFEEIEAENESNMENFLNDATTNFPSVKKKSRSKRKVRTEVEESTNNVAECTNSQPSQPQTSPATPPICDKSSMTNPLETELENIKKEQEEVTKLHQEKKSMLVSECEKEMLEIQKKYDAIMEESEMCLVKKMKVLEEYYDLVYANKVLAEALAKAYDDTLDEEKTEKETNSVRILEIPTSALVQSKNRCTIRIPTGHILRAPAPHLRSSSSLFTSLPTLSTPQTGTDLNNVIDKKITEKLPSLQSSHSSLEFDSFYDMGCSSLPFLGSN